MSLMGDRIKMKREENGLTMAELGSILGVQASAVNKWEKGHVSNIKRSTISQMAKLFDVNPVWLMGIDGPEEVEGFDTAAAFEAEWTNRGGGRHPISISDLEYRLIRKYRNSDERTKATVRLLLGLDNVPNVPQEIPHLEEKYQPHARAARLYKKPSDKLIKRRKEKI